MRSIKKSNSSFISTKLKQMLESEYWLNDTHIFCSTDTNVPVTGWL